MFRITDDSDDFKVCALMMSATDPWITLGMDYEICLTAFEGSFREVHIVSDNGEIAGFAILQLSGSFSGYIQTICVSEGYRGKGVGTALLSYCEERILKISPNIFICVSSFNTRARKLYESFGFRLVGKLDNFLKEGFSELLLRKSVGPRVGYHAQ
ncbi:MAG: GNAT family N-acetyltransferase [Bacteroidales bacterium]|nr:GNAT family N-acetyltransferase [Bacteroidales bacterium]